MRQGIYLMGVLPLIFSKIYMPQSQEYKAVKSLENAINDYNWSPRRFAENITSMHKTLQQTLIRTIVEVIKKVGEDDYPVDSRNNASHALCRKIISSGLLDEISLPLI